MDNLKINHFWICLTMNSADKRVIDEISIEAPVRQQVLEKKFARNSKGDTTPSVLNTEKLAFVNAGATLVTKFDDGQPGQEITLLGDNNTTIANNAVIKTNTGANKLLAPNKVYRFTNFGGIWYEDA